MDYAGLFVINIALWVLIWLWAQRREHRELAEVREHVVGLNMRSAQLEQRVAETSNEARKAEGLATLAVREATRAVRSSSVPPPPKTPTTG